MYSSYFCVKSRSTFSTFHIFVAFFTFSGKLHLYICCFIHYVQILFDFNRAEAHPCITEERLQILITIIFAEEFQKQEKNIISIISGNFEITMKEIKDLKAEVRDLTGSLEFTENVIENKVENWKPNLIILRIKFKTSGTTRSIQTIFNINQ